MVNNPDWDEGFVERYDADNAAGDDHAYYRRVADDIGAAKIIDLGCGTGLLTRALATRNREVIGVDPSPTMLGYARRQPGAERVTWIPGDASVVPSTHDADLVVSTGNTMMHIDPRTFPQVLDYLRDALKSGGLLAFETRNPAVRQWKRWNPPGIRIEQDASLGQLREWLVWRSAQSETVLYFRTDDEVVADLERARFANVSVNGDWNGGPVTASSGSLVFRAEAA